MECFKINYYGSEVASTIGDLTAPTLLARSGGPRAKIQFKKKIVFLISGFGRVADLASRDEPKGRAPWGLNGKPSRAVQLGQQTLSRAVQAWRPDRGEGFNNLDLKARDVPEVGETRGRRNHPRPVLKETDRETKRGADSPRQAQRRIRRRNLGPPQRKEEGSPNFNRFRLLIAVTEQYDWGSHCPNSIGEKRRAEGQNPVQKEDCLPDQVSEFRANPLAKHGFGRVADLVSRDEPKGRAPWGLNGKPSRAVQLGQQTLSRAVQAWRPDRGEGFNNPDLKARDVPEVGETIPDQCYRASKRGAKP
ncbi:hypothetical protein U1Q18_008851 [Sarracenia purpurea var. burkii]